MELGIAIKESGADRSKLYVTSKVLGGIENIPKAINTSLEKLGLDYVDLYDPLQCVHRCELTSPSLEGTSFTHLVLPILIKISKLLGSPWKK